MRHRLLMLLLLLLIMLLLNGNRVHFDVITLVCWFTFDCWLGRCVLNGLRASICCQLLSVYVQYEFALALTTSKFPMKNWSRSSLIPIKQNWSMFKKSVETERSLKQNKPMLNLRCNGLRSGHHHAWLQLLRLKRKLVKLLLGLAHGDVVPLFADDHAILGHYIDQARRRHCVGDVGRRQRHGVDGLAHAFQVRVKINLILGSETNSNTFTVQVQIKLRY